MFTLTQIQIVTDSTCDLTDADIILAVETDLTGVGAAVMNRLTKAADGKRYID